VETIDGYMGVSAEAEKKVKRNHLVSDLKGTGVISPCGCKIQDGATFSAGEKPGEK